MKATKTRFNKLTAWVLTLAMLMTFIPGFTLSASAALDTSVSGGCNGDHTGYTVLTLNKNGDIEITKVGNYYLEMNYNSSVKNSFIYLKSISGDITICLNGHKITYNGGSNSDILDGHNKQNKFVTVNLCDCKGTGILENTASKGNCVRVDGDVTFNMYGGTLKGKGTGVLTAPGGTYGDSRDNGIFNMYGGTIMTDNYAVQNEGVFNYHGGTISSEKSEGAVYNDYWTGDFYPSGFGYMKVYGEKTVSIYLPYYRTIDTSNMTGGMITVNAESNDSDIPVTGSNKSDISSYFRSAKEGYIIQNGENNVVTLHKHTYSEATCSALPTCACGYSEGEYDDSKHAPAEEWSYENGKHYHKCLYGCDAHLDETACSGGEATCLELAVCEVCNNEYGTVNPDNHESDEVYYDKISDFLHGKYYSCCQALKNDELHDASVAATCGGIAYCSVCNSSYGGTDNTNHTGVLEWFRDSDSYCSQKWSCCGIYEQRYADHKYSYTKGDADDTIVGTCTNCGANGTLRLILDSGVYNGSAFSASVSRNGAMLGRSAMSGRKVYFDCADGCTDAGHHSVSLTLGGVTVTKDFEIQKRPLSAAKVYAFSKSYDGTADIDINSVLLDGVVIYSKGYYESYDFDDVKDDVKIDLSNAELVLPSAAPGYYETAVMSGFQFTGVDVDNYLLPEDAVEVHIVNTSGHEYEIRECALYITAENQEVYGDNGIDTTKFILEGVPEGFTVSGITLEETDNYIVVNYNNLKVVQDGTGEDVTDYFYVSSSYDANLTRVCEGHTTDGNGFCETGNCDAYDIPDMAVETDEWGSEVIWYEIENAGQLYWFAQQVNDYGNNYINGRLTRDIEVNEDLTAENLMEWTPIGSDYPTYCGTFDGQGHLISGLYINQPDMDYVGFFGGTDYSYTVTGINIANSYFKGRSNVGAIFGYAGSNISDCAVYDDVTVIGESYVGGIAGGTSNGELKNSYSLADASDTEGDKKGLVGYNCLAISNCYTTADELVSHNDTNYGGSIENSYYLAETETEDGGKTKTQFENGEVAYLLQSGIIGETIYDEEWNEIGIAEPTKVWGQWIGEEEYPRFSDNKVYRDEHNGTYAYRNEIYGFDIIYLDKDKKTATVVFENAGTYTVIFTDYGENNSLSDMELKEITVTEPKAVAVTYTKDFLLGADDKIMLWSDMTNLVPKCEAYIVK